MISPPRTGVRLVVIVVSAMITTMLSQPPASAGAYTITISAGATSGVTSVVGDTATFTPNAEGAVLNVDELEAALASGAVMVGPGASSVRLAADITSASANNLTIDAPAQLGANVTFSLDAGDLTFASSLDGAHALRVNGSGSLVVAGPVGATTLLSSFSADVASIDTGAVSVTGNLALTSTGAPITQRGAWTVEGTSHIDAGTAAIALTNATNDFGGQVSLTGGQTQVADRNALALGSLAVGSLRAVAYGGLVTGSGTVAGELSLSSEGGSITQAGVLTVSGTSTIDAGAGAVTLTDPSNDFVGAVTLAGGSTQVTDQNALTLATVDVAALTARSAGALSAGSGVVAGDLSLNSGGGAITQTGALSVGGTSTIDAGAGAITLANAANDFGGPVSLTGGAVQVLDSGDLVLSSGSVSSFAARAGGSLSVAGLPAPITSTGALTLVSDQLGLGTGALELGDGATLTAGAPVALYAPSRALVSVGTGVKINGSGYTPGPAYVNTDRERWGVSYPDGTAKAPYTFFYAEQPPAPPAGPVFPGPVTGVDMASSSDPAGSATARQGCATATGHGVGSITVATYGDNPVGTADFRATGRWFDVQVPTGSAFTSVDLTCAPGPSATAANTLYWWDGTQWRVVTGQRHDSASGLTSVTLTGSSSPSLAELTGTVFAMGTRTVVSRLAGPDRVQTAIEVSRRAYRDGSAGAVVLAADDSYADALVGGPLAVAERGPLLLTAPGRVPTAVKDELRRVLRAGGTVYLLGGDAALSSRVERQVGALGLVLRRLGGETRYDTAVRVARRLPGPRHVFLATGTDFPDALSAGAAAAHTDGVVLLTAGTRVPAATQRWLTRHPVLPRTAIGGPAASAVPDATRLAGPDRYATASLVAEQLFSEPAAVGVASGEAFADALSAVTLLGPLDAPLLLTRSGRLPAPTSNWLGRHRATLVEVTVVGGTSAVTSSTQDGIVAAVGGIG
jgi:putative cell wall-binding protein